MGHADKHLIKVFSGPARLELAEFLDRPDLFDPATRDFAFELNRLETSWSSAPDWPYALYVRRAYNLIKKEYSDTKDHSGALLFHHPMNVAADSYRMARLFKFDEKEATTVWIAGLCHDYIEDAKTEQEQRNRKTKIHNLFHAHDPDVLNLVCMLSNFDKEAPYFDYVEGIGRKSGFSPQSTTKAQIAALIIKHRDSSHNSRADRNIFILKQKAKAESTLAHTQNEEDRAKAQGILDWVNKKETKIRMYHMNMGLMVAKLKGLLGAEEGLNIEATMVDFLLTPAGIPYQISDYHQARRLGLGEKAHTQFTQRLNAEDSISGHTLVISSRRADSSDTLQNQAA